MQKTGQITSITPDGGYNNQRGDRINTFQMTITCPEGTYAGQIGSKAQTYPIAVGEQISVEVTNTEHGTRFTKFNPQYAGQGSRGGGGKKSDPDWDAIAVGKSRCAVVCAAIQSRQIEVASEMDCDKWVQYIILGHNRVPQQVTVQRTEEIPPDQFPNDDEVC